MKNIIPFKKDVIFDTNIDEITSISLENTLNVKNNNLSGEFIISGEYKVVDEIRPFNKRLPFEIIIDDMYDTRNATVDIDDFYYEIKSNNVLFVSIDVLLDKLEKIEQEVRVDEPKKEPIIEEESISIFDDSNFKTESYVEYNIYILREGDTIETILDKYGVSLDELKNYNDLDNLKIGDKIIIPSNESNQ